jgi:hypothetical protein
MVTTDLINSLSKKLVSSAVYINAEERKYQNYILRNAIWSLNDLRPSVGLIILEWLTMSSPKFVSVIWISKQHQLFLNLTNLKLI